MQTESKWSLSQQEKDRLISALTPELAVLRTKAEISQEELAELIGISRQTYGAVERGTRKMTWTTFLSLVLFYDCNRKTHLLLRSIQPIPQEMVRKFNAGGVSRDLDLRSFLGDSAYRILESLDEQAIQSIRTMILVEYARCTATPGEIVVKSFDGVNFAAAQTVEDVEAEKALTALKKREARDE